MKVKPMTGFAIMNKKGDRLEMFDARMPIYWLRHVACDAMKVKGYDGKIVKVTVQASE